MSVPARSQEDPYAFTESAPLPANTSLFKQQQQHPVSTVSAASSPVVATTPSSVPVIQAGTSLLANNSVNRLNHVVQQQQQQRTLLGTTAAKLAPIKVTLVQSPTGGILGKARLNGTTITSSPQGTVFRTVTVPQTTTIVQRPMAASSSGATPTVFTKPLQVQISPQQAAAVAAAGGKFTARRILASKSPNVSPVTATAVSGSAHPTGGIQTVRIVKTSPANVLQTVGAGRTTAITSADGTRRFISHSGAASLLGSPVVVTTSGAPGTTTSQQQQLPQNQQQSSPQQLPTISPTKIRLIQPQPQGKIFLHTPNSGNSLAAATHISNPISIAALRNSLAKQNPSLLNKIVVQQQQQQNQQQQSPQQVQIAVSGGSASSPSTSNGLPTVRMIPTSTAVTAINIRRAVSAAATATSTVAAQPKRQMSLETGTTTVMVPTMARPVTSSSASPAPVVVKQVKVIPVSSPQQASPATNRPPTIQIPQTLLQQRAKTPTQSILKPQPPRPQLQPTAVTTVKAPQKLVIAAPKTTQQQHQQQQLHPQQVMVLASPKSLGGTGQAGQQQVMVVTAPKGLGGHQQHQVVVLAPFKPGQLTAVNRQPQQLMATSLMKQIQQQQQQQILTSPVVKTIQKVQQQPQQIVTSPKPLQQPQVVTTSPVVKQVVQNQVVTKPTQQQQVLASSVAKTLQQRQFVATSIAKSIQQQQQVVVTSVAKPTQQPPQVVATTSVVVKQPVQQSQQPQQVVINAALKAAPPPPQQQQQPLASKSQQQFVVVPPPKPVPQPTPPPQQQQQQPPTHQPSPVAVAPTPPPPAPTPPVTQDDFTIPSFIIPKQKEAKKQVVPEKVVVQQQQPVKQQSPVPVAAKPTHVAVPQPPPTPPPPSPVVPVAPQVLQAPPAAVVAPPPPPPIVPEPQLPSTSAMPIPSPKPKLPKESGGKSVKRAAKRSYSRSSHHETLERIDEPVVAAPPIPKVYKWTPPGAISIPVNREWHAPDTWIFDICPPGTRSYEELENAPLAMDCWFEEQYASSEFDADLIRPRKVGGRKGGAVEAPMDDGELVELSLEERSVQRKALMRRRAVQFWKAQGLRDPEPARKRLKAVARVLNKLEKHRETMLSRNGGTDLPKCQRAGCERDAMVATTHCRQHIADNTEQRLFQRCTAKFSDNSQCQVPVFDIRHELVLCREHAWKHDNHDKMSAEVRLLKKPTAPAAITVPAVTPAAIALKKKPPKMPLVKVVQPVSIVTPAAAITTNKSSKPSSKKKKKLTPFQQQMALHQQQYKQQYAVKPTLPPPPYPAQQQQAHPVKQQPVAPMYRQQKYQPPTPVQIVPPPTPQVNRNLHIPLNQPQRPQQQVLIGGHQQQHMISRSEDLMLNYQGQAQNQQYSHQQVQQILAAAAGAGGGGVTVGATQDLLNICENSSAYASSEDTGVGGLSESELMAAQDVIEEIPFEIGNLNNVLSQLPPDAFNELLFSEQEQNGPPFESTREEEEDLERALEAVGEHVKSLEDMAVESANLFGDFLDNVDDEMLDGPDMCAAAEQMLVVQSPGGPNDIRGLVHT
uniref:(northern house mosquito) hypothetical protein n=1 Tax=Culex pipiens TaxID=7175 RepID=A0A8D8EU97_CULPI